MEVIQRFLDWLKPEWTESRIYGDQDDPDEIEDDEDEGEDSGRDNREDDEEGGSKPSPKNDSE